LAVSLGCGTKKKAETPATEEAAKSAESSQSAYGEQKSEEPQATPGTEETQPAEESQSTQETTDWTAAYDNPKPGIDPVCGMTVEREYVEVATIGDKKYACCSAGCVAMLTADPDKYLKGDAATESPH
jgi:YHS domain-containing protein